MNTTNLSQLLKIPNVRSLFSCIVVLMISLEGQSVNAQTQGTASSFKVSADLVSSYVWRGSIATGNLTPNFQPALAYTSKNFEIGIWGSTDFVGNYKEFDPYVIMTTGHLKFGLTDYNFNFSRANYFNYKNSETGHRFEGTIGFAGTDAFPVSISWNTMFYGFDKQSDDTTKQAFSTYVELGYTKGPASLFFGFTPWAGYYNNYGATVFNPGASKKIFSVVNLGGSFTKALKLSDNFTLPIKTTIIVNPSATYSRNDFVHLVFGITF
jgi:hypothetical protein